MSRCVRQGRKEGRRTTIHYSALHGCNMPPWCMRAIRYFRQRSQCVRFLHSTTYMCMCSCVRLCTTILTLESGSLSMTAIGPGRSMTHITMRTTCMPSQWALRAYLGAWIVYTVSLPRVITQSYLRIYPFPSGSTN